MTNQSTAPPLDPADMLGQVTAWPRLLRQGWDQPLDLPTHLAGRRAIVCAGMGGSAIGAGICAEYLADQLTVPMTVVRDYDLPHWVDEQCLVICQSYSGGTEETLAAYQQAVSRRAAVLVITTGGALAERASDDRQPLIRYTYEAQPRAVLPLNLGVLLRVLSELGYCPESDPTGALSELDQLVAGDFTGEQLAKRMHGRLPIIYGAGWLGEAARRLKGQVSENAKQAAAWEVLPELNHNALVGYEYPADLADHLIFVLLRSSLEHPRHQRRFTITKDILDQRGLSWLEINGRGADRLSQLVTVLYQGDLVSVRLAYRNQVDPTPVEIITYLKEKLAEA